MTQASLFLVPPGPILGRVFSAVIGSPQAAHHLGVTLVPHTPWCVTTGGPASPDIRRSPHRFITSGTP
ncbi:hypothetical protein [Streptomyces hawaiiensis]|uniref:hypothetical protein n=1 Tax=Streptomyces hawaiiensis TaxID=67305 RepID=UPI003661C0AD